MSLDQTQMNKQILPDGMVAVVTGKSPTGRLGQPYEFDLQIGIVRRYPTKDELISNLRSQGYSFYHVPIGAHRGYIGIKPTAPERFIYLSVQRDTLGDVTLELYDAHSEQILRRGKVPSDNFRRGGFNLDQEDIDNDGEQLTPELSQLLYDFLLGQSQFRP